MFKLFMTQNELLVSLYNLQLMGLLSRVIYFISQRDTANVCVSNEDFGSLYYETVSPNRHREHAPRNNCSHSEQFAILAEIISSPYFHVLSILSSYVICK